MKKIVSMTIATLLAAVSFAPLAHAQFGAAPAELDLIKVRDDLYVIHNEGVPGNVTALITDDGVLLVDDKFEIDFDNLMASLRSVTDQPVSYVINTHYHGDHSGGNAKLQALNARVVASEQARAKMVQIGQPGLPDITVEESARLYVGGKTVELYRFGRSHTDGDLVVLFPDHGVLAAGDMYTVGEGLPLLVDYPGGGSVRAWTGTLDRALMLDFETVIPGHGRVVTKEDMRAFRDDTVRLRQMIHEMLTQNRPAADIEAVMRSEFGWQDFHVGMALSGLMIELR